MAFLVIAVLLSALSAVTRPFPHNAVGNALKRSAVDFESSGFGPDEPNRGIVKVVRLDPHQLAQHAAHFRRAPGPRRAPSPGVRMPFPAFLARGRPGSAAVPRGASSPLRHLRPERPSEPELKKRLGVQMWQKAMDKGERGKMSMSLSLSLKDAAKQTCTAVPFTQRVTAEGCDIVTVHNKLCFGQCSSLFIPPGGEGSGGHRRGPCSRCAPSKAHTVAVPLRCGAEVRERRVMVVEECRCETGREEGSVEAVSSWRL